MSCERYAERSEERTREGGASERPAERTGGLVNVRPVVAAPDPVLSLPAKEVDPRDPSVIALADDLLATMRVFPGCVGLAAVQVGMPWHLFVLDVAGHPKT